MIVSTSPPIFLISQLSQRRDGGVHLTGFKLVSLFIPLIYYVHLMNSALHSLHWCFTRVVTLVRKVQLISTLKYFTVKYVILFNFNSESRGKFNSRRNAGKINQFYYIIIIVLSSLKLCFILSYKLSRNFSGDSLPRLLNCVKSVYVVVCTEVSSHTDQLTVRLPS